MKKIHNRRMEKSVRVKRDHLQKHQQQKSGWASNSLDIDRIFFYNAQKTFKIVVLDRNETAV